MDGAAEPSCDECGFDPRAWRRRDAETLFGALGWWWKAALAGTEQAAANRRPQPGVWSALEYGAHTAGALAFLRSGLEAVLATDGAALPPEPHVPPVPGTTCSDLDEEEILAAVEQEGRSLAALAAEGEPAALWHRRGSAAGEVMTAGQILEVAIHEASHHQMDLGRCLAAVGAGTPARVGRIAQVNVSDGGVPKLAITEAEVSLRGVAGDRQADSKHHGRPFQALCLWSSEVLEELSGLGHPIAAGLAGENVTISGFDWSALRPGARVQLGSVMAELSFPSIPCAKQTRWFSDGDFRRIDHDVNPQWARWYAWVRQPGCLATGDPAILQP
ncbi:MAG TPA: MOSC domain-containing protein [Acidimicrobiales bacterium]|jgi:MOSC domain-containing protein YiiM|nr:MOSC domain-containing protein [Acidimicrobiales bacterium]